MGYTQPLFNVRKIAGGYSIFPDGATNDDLRIYANPIDAYPNISLLGSAGVTIELAGSNYFVLADQALGTFLEIRYSNPDVSITSATDKNLYLKPQGTGKIKVAGTATGTGDVAINGHYDILDSAGATIKLATVA